MKTKKNNTGKAIGIVLMAIILAFGGSVAGWYAHEKNWFGIAEMIGEKQESGSTGGLIVGEGAGNDDIQVSASKLSADEARAAGVTKEAESSYSLTATVSPDYAAAQKFDWEIKFNNASSEWATGKAVTDYVTVTPAEDGAATATVSCKKAFAEPMTIVCAVRGYDLTATCSVDYGQKVESIDVWFEKLEKSLGGASGGRVDLPEGEDVYISMVDDGGAEYIAYELHASFKMSDDVYTLEETPELKVSFRTTSAGGDDGHTYFTDGTPSGTGGSWSRGIEEIEDALNPYGNSLDSNGEWHPHTPIMWNGSMGAYYKFNVDMLESFKAYVHTSSFASGELKSETTYYCQMAKDEIENLYRDRDEETVLWRVDARVVGKYGTFQRPDSYLMYYWSAYSGAPQSVDLSDDGLIL